MKKRIHNIEKVQIKYAKSMPPKLVVVAQGMANSSGWTDIELRHIGTDKGLYEFELIGTPPSGISLPVLTEVGAMYIFDEIPTVFDGVVVYSETNHILVKSNNEHSKVDNFEVGDVIHVIEQLKGVSVKDDVLTLRVPSNGCTSKENFVVDVAGFTGVSPWSVTVILSLIHI